MSHDAPCRNFNELALKNPVSFFDDHLCFVEDGHEYFHDGVKVATSVTSVLKPMFGEFRPLEVIAKCLPAWQKNPSSPYYELVRGKTLEAATDAILESWNAKKELGTKLHYELEQALNTNEVCPDIQGAVDLFEREQWTPFRTELSVCWYTKHRDVPAVAGQLDVLLKDRAGKYVIVDLKRTEKNIHAEMLPKTNLPLPFPKETRANDFNKFSLQLSMYCVMLKQDDICVEESNRYVLQVHPVTNETRLINMRAFDNEARALLDQLSGCTPDEAPPDPGCTTGEPPHKLRRIG